MATHLELPTKRPNKEEMGSGSGLMEAASKKAKTEKASEELHFESYEQCLEHFDGNKDTAWDYWEEYQDRVKKHCKLRDFQFFLKYIGDQDTLNRVQTYDDVRKHYSKYRTAFGQRPWKVRRSPGGYTDYQRLFVYDLVSTPLS